MSSAMPVPTGLRTAERGDGRGHARRPAHERLLKPNGQAGAFSARRQGARHQALSIAGGGATLTPRTVPDSRHLTHHTGAAGGPAAPADVHPDLVDTAGGLSTAQARL
jgi:hypothetical protein